jgi:hypothetical protein
MKIKATITGALVGPLAGFFGLLFLWSITPPPDGCAARLCHSFGPFFSLLYGVPLGLLIGLLCGLLWDYRTDDKVVVRSGEDDNVAVLNEELKMLAERGGIVKVRVELTSYANHDAIRGDLERAGFLEMDERTLLEKVLSCGSVKWVTGTIHAARIEELAALSFVKSVEGTRD